MKIIPGQNNNDYFEGKVNSILNKTINETGKIGLSNLDSKNRAINMVNSGSKGKLTNIAQMIACLGQQNVDGKRIPYGFEGRTLPHYYKYDDSSKLEDLLKIHLFLVKLHKNISSMLWEEEKD